MTAIHFGFFLCVSLRFSTLCVRRGFGVSLHVAFIIFSLKLQTNLNATAQMLSVEGKEAYVHTCTQGESKKHQQLKIRELQTVQD